MARPENVIENMDDIKRNLSKIMDSLIVSSVKENVYKSLLDRARLALSKEETSELNDLKYDINRILERKTTALEKQAKQIENNTIIDCLEIINLSRRVIAQMPKTEFNGVDIQSLMVRITGMLDTFKNTGFHPGN